VEDRRIYEAGLFLDADTRGIHGRGVQDTPGQGSAIKL